MRSRFDIAVQIFAADALGGQVGRQILGQSLGQGGDQDRSGRRCRLWISSSNAESARWPGGRRSCGSTRIPVDR
jgi:hypothetical protein